MPAYKIEEKSKPTFIVFDIKDFYPSISKYFLQKALEFVKIKVSITQEEEKIIYHSHKTLLFKHQETWMNKGGELFDVTMMHTTVPKFVDWYDCLYFNLCFKISTIKQSEKFWSL